MAEEESLLNEDLFMSHVTDTPLTKAEIGNLFSEASNSSSMIWKESKTLKDKYKQLSGLAEKDVLRVVGPLVAVPEAAGRAPAGAPTPFVPSANTVWYSSEVFFSCECLFVTFFPVFFFFP
jgi:hypothetical protein